MTYPVPPRPARIFLPAFLLGAGSILFQSGTVLSQTVYSVAGDFRMSGMLTGNFEESRLFKYWSDGLRSSVGLMVRGNLKFNKSSRVSFNSGIGLDFTGFKFSIRQNLNVAIPELAKDYPDILIYEINFSQLHLVIPAEISLRLFRPFWVFGILQFPGVEVTTGLENRLDIGSRQSKVVLYQLDAFGNYSGDEIKNSRLTSRVADEYVGELKRFESSFVYGASAFWEAEEFGFAAGMNLGKNLVKPARSLLSKNSGGIGLLYFRFYRIL